MKAFKILEKGYYQDGENQIYISEEHQELIKKLELIIPERGERTVFEESEGNEMKTETKEEQIGKFLSFILRHHPETIGITLDRQGYADVEELLNKMKKNGKNINRELLEKIVKENNKKRYSFNEDHTKIRANQGHSIEVDLELKSILPPDILYHGTAVRFLESIQKEGIKKQTRQYVHLSKDYKTALEVGKRHGKPTVLLIDARKMAEDGEIFYLSENGVFLCEKVEPKYIIEEKENSINA